MIRFGMPTLIETNGPEECAALCGELGLDFIELNMNMPQYQPDKIDLAACKAIAEAYGISYTVHLDENLNVSDFNPYVAAAYRRTVEETIALAGGLGISVINMHLPRGVYFTLPGKKVYLFSVYREQYLKSIADFRTLCEQAVGGAPIRLCIENSDGFTDFQREALDMLLESPVFGLTYDIGHNHGCGGLDEPYILAHKNRLRHMHMHDAAGAKNHLALGSGELDLKRYLTLAEETQCRVVLETKTIEGLKQSVHWLETAGFRGNPCFPCSGRLMDFEMI